MADPAATSYPYPASIFDCLNPDFEIVDENKYPEFCIKTIINGGYLNGTHRF